jgi:hypothetical protein
VGNFELLEPRVLLSATSDALAAFRLQLATGLAAYRQTLAVDRQVVADDLTKFTSGDPSLVAKLRSDLAAFASKFRADQQALLTTREADVAAFRADRGNPEALTADRLKLQEDSANLVGALKQDQTDHAALLKQDHDAIAASRAAAGAVLKQDLAKMASDRGSVAQQIAIELQQLRNTLGSISTSGGTLYTGSSGSGTIAGGTLIVDPSIQVHIDSGGQGNGSSGGLGSINFNGGGNLSSGGLTFGPTSGNLGGINFNGGGNVLRPGGNG